jgi:hypothetical protein
VEATFSQEFIAARVSPWQKLPLTVLTRAPCLPGKLMKGRLQALACNTATKSMQAAAEEAALSRRAASKLRKQKRKSADLDPPTQPPCISITASAHADAPEAPRWEAYAVLVVCRPVLVRRRSRPLIKS